MRLVSLLAVLAALSANALAPSTGGDPVPPLELTIGPYGPELHGWPYGLPGGVDDSSVRVIPRDHSQPTTPVFVRKK